MIEIERRCAYLVTERAPGGRLRFDASGYSVISNPVGKTLLLGPNATLSQLRTYCSVVDPSILTYPTYPLE